MRYAKLIIAAILLVGLFHGVQAGIEQYSITPGSNNASPPVGAPESMAPSAVNNTMREMMAYVREWAEQAVSGNWNADSGSADAYVITPEIAPSSLVSGQVFRFKAANTNTGDSNFTVGSLSTITMVKISDTTLDAGDVLKDAIHTVIYDGTYFQLQPTTQYVAARVAESASPITTEGDIIRGSSAGSEERLAIGSAGQTLVVSGSNVSWDSPPLPRGYLGGMQTSQAADTDHDITIAVGTTRGADNDENITLSSAMTKRIDATWSAGSGNGGLSSSLTAPANDTWYHVHAIMVNGSADVGFDTSVTAANLVADHSATAYRRIGSVLTDGSANIIAFKQYGDEFVWTAVATDYTSADPGAAEVTTTLSTPLGVEVRANLAASFGMTSGGAGNQDFYTSFYHPDVTAPTPSNMPMLGAHNSNGETVSAETGGAFYVRTNTSSQIQHISTNPTGTMTLVISTMGWIDDRGRND